MGTVQEQEHSSDDDIQYHNMEHDSELDISHNPSPVDQGNNPSDSVDREGHASKSSGRRQKGNLQGMKQKNTNKEVILHLIFFIIVLIGTFGKTDKMTYWCKKLLDDSFVKTNFQVGVEERNFKNISHISHFWKFAETVMIDSLYGNLQDDTHQHVGYMLEDYKLIGTPRLRQVKVRNDSCIINEAFKRLVSECYNIYSSANEDKGPFGPGIGTAWTYSTEEELRGSSYSGRFSTYGGGGYYEDLSLNRSETIEKLLTLKNNLWVTRGTRAIFLDFIVYNANIDAILTLKLVFERAPIRGIVTSSFRNIVKFHHYVTTYDYFVAVCECMFVAFTFFYTMNIVVLKREDLHLWYSWNLRILVYAYTIIFFRIYNHMVIEPQIIQLFAEEKFANFKSFGLYQEIYNLATGLLLIITWFKIFKYIRFDTIFQSSLTFKRCCGYIAAFPLIFLISCVTFVNMVCELY